jgi:hypothetical protein
MTGGIEVLQANSPRLRLPGTMAVADIPAIDWHSHKRTNDNCTNSAGQSNSGSA